jgi:hypothetical protein
MNCPDIDHLIDLAGGGVADPELQAHLESCGACRGDLFLIRELPAAFQPQLTVPEHLVQRAMQDIMAVRAGEEKRRGVRAQLLGTTVLGSLTAAGVVLITNAGSGTPGTLLTFSLAVGVLSAATQFGTSQRRELDRA